MSTRRQILHARQLRARQLRIDIDAVNMAYAIHKYGRWFAWVCFI